MGATLAKRNLRMASGAPRISAVRPFVGQAARCAAISMGLHRLRLLEGAGSEVAIVFTLGLVLLIYAGDVAAFCLLSNKSGWNTGPPKNIGHVTGHTDISD
jgi:hypothetical protein